MSAPRLSVVAASRNDDHGGRLAERTQWFVDGLEALARRFEMPVELVLVEWNPPEGRPPLAEAQRWPAPGSPLEVRIVTVAPSVHRALVGGSGLPMMQMLAKNVGIRRARAEGVLSTNVDVLLAPEAFAAITGAVKPRTVYRVDRYDVEFPFAGARDYEEALEFCTAHPVRYARRDGTYYPGQGRMLPIYQSLGDYVSCELRRGGEGLRRAARGRRLAGPSLGGPGEAGPGPGGGSPPARAVRGLGRALAGLPDRLDAVVSLATAPKLHVNACGDFTFMSARDWADLRGYPEWIVHSWSLDTVLVHQAHGAGMGFVELAPPAVCYHMEHAQSGWTPEGHTAYFRRVEATGIRAITSRELRRYKALLARGRRQGRIELFNGPEWGMAQVELPEAPIHPSAV